jgi:O-antigen chain-terminating methyltransferase
MNQDVDVQQIMERIRDDIRQRRGADASVPAASAAPPAGNGHVAAGSALLHSLHDIQAISFESHRRLLGPVVVLLKRILRKLLTPILDRQVAYNAAAAAAIGRLDRRLNQERLAMERRLRELGTATLEAQRAQRTEMVEAQRQLHEEVLAVESRVLDAAIAHSQGALRQSSQATMNRIAAVERRLRRLVHMLEIGALDRGPAVSAGTDLTPPVPQPLEPEIDYAGFEDHFRGSEEDIKARQRIYLPYFRGRADVLDIGCGRGEFLELLREDGIAARGVDLDLDMVLQCRDKHLDVAMADAFIYLEALADDSLGGVFAAQVIEHLPARRIAALVKLCHRKLAPGAALILETPNPTCLMVFADTFYRDFSHVQPLHPETMRFLLETTGFQAVEVRFSGSVDDAMKIPRLDVLGTGIERFNAAIERLNALLFGFLDYAVIGRKA